MEQHLLFNPGPRPFGPYPLLRPAIAFVVGILAAHYILTDLSGWFYCAATLLVLLFLIIRKLFRTRQAKSGYSIIPYPNRHLWPYLIFALLGGWNYNLWRARQPIPCVTPDNEPRYFVVTEKPTETRFGRKEVQGFLLRSSKPFRQGHLVRWENTSLLPPKIEKGDTLFFRGPILPFAHPSCPGSFDQRSFYFRQGILSYTTLRDTQHVAVRKGNYRPDIIEKIRLFCLEKSDRYIDNEVVRGIVLQMLLGIRAELDAETKSTFRNTGVMHILAVSGLHVGIIYLVLSGLAGFFFRRGSPERIIAVAIVIVLVWFYAVLAGFRPSVVRASLMLSFIAAGEVFKRRVPLLNSLSAAALVNLFWKPADIFDLGFVLSYSAVGGIALLYRPLYSLWQAPSVLKRLWELTCLSVSAQAGTLGVTLVYFGQFPVLFVLANWVAVPAAGIIIYSALLFLLSPWPLLSELLASWLEIFVGGVLNFLKALDAVPHSSLRNLSFQPVEGFLVMLMIFLIVHSLMQPGFKTFRRVLVTAILWQVFLLSQEAADNFFPRKLVLCGGKDAGLYLRRAENLQPILKFKDIPTDVSVAQIHSVNQKVCVIFSLNAREKCPTDSRVIWNDGRVITRGKLNVVPSPEDLLGPGIGARKALELKRLLAQHGHALHAVSVDGFAPL